MTTLRDLIQWPGGQHVPVRRVATPLFSLQDDINRLFNDFFSDQPLNRVAGQASALLAPVMDVRESEKEILISAELPGISRDDVELTISDGYLILKGEKKEEKTEGEEDGEYYRRERSYGSFHRALALPEIAEGDKAEAEFKNGVLTVRIPKRKEAAAKAHKVQIKAA